MKDIVIFGDTQYAEKIYRYIKAENEINVVAFTNNKEFITRNTILGVPVIPFEELEKYLSYVGYYRCMTGGSSVVVSGGGG